MTAGDSGVHIRRSTPEDFDWLGRLLCGHLPRVPLYQRHGCFCVTGKPFTSAGRPLILNPMYEPRHAPLLTRAQFVRRLARHFGLGLAVIAGSLAIGMLGYRYFEGMAWIDAYLNAAMLLGGMGPVDPQLTTEAGKLFAGLYALYAGMVVLVVAGVVLAPVFHRFIHRFHLEEEEKRRRAR